MLKKTILGILLIAFLSAACGDNSTAPNSNSLSLSMAIDNTLPKSSAADIVLSKVKILIRDLKIKAFQGNDSLNVKTGIFVVNLKMDGSANEIAVSNVPAGTYESAKFEIHKLGGSETSPDTDFIDANDNSKRYSVVVEGTYKGNSFSYKSEKSAHQTIKFDTPLVLADGADFNVTLTVNPNNWFVKNGTALNPNDAKNINDIDNLIKDSFNKAFKDNNRDGKPD